MSTRNINIKIPLGVGTYPSYIPYDTYKKVASGGNTPRALRQLGIYIENNYDATVSRVIDGPCIFTFDQAGQGTKYNACASSVGGSINFDSVPEPAYIDVIPKLLEKWRQSEFNLGVTVGEGRESLSLMTGRLRSIAESARHVGNRNLGAALRHLGAVPPAARRRAQRALDSGDVSSAYLELNLGWAPLIQDISALAEMITLNPREHVIRSSFKLMRLSGYAVGGGIPANKVKVSRNERRLHLKVVVSAPPSTVERLGLTDAASIVWSLTSLSFVADYFLPIGATLESLHALRVLPVTKCVETWVEAKEGTLHLEPGKKYAGVWIQNPVDAFSRVTVMKRRVSTSLPSAWSIVAQVPQRAKSYWDPSLRQVATMSALAHQRLRKLDVITKLFKRTV